MRLDMQKRDKMFEGKRAQEKIVEEWEAKGFKINMNFPNEYVLLANKDLDKVRIYEDGSVWATNPSTGEYEKSP